jgi:cobalt-zinc-cadmium efflux system outer membrane protein
MGLNGHISPPRSLLTPAFGAFGLPAFLAFSLWPVQISAAQNTLTWPEVKERFEAANPSLRAAQLNIDESRALEVTAFLRPNPDFTLSTDGTQLTRYQGVWRPFAGTQITNSLTFLHERQQKRELRRDSARESTAIAESNYFDQQRGLLFNLRTAFVQVLQAKAVLENAKDNLEYWDREVEVNRNRLKAGDLARIDLNRMELQRVQFESDYETAIVNVRAAKVQILLLLNERTPIEQFDISGAFDFGDELQPLEQFREESLEARPDLAAAAKNVELAKINHRVAVANGSTDPTFGAWWTHNPSFNNPYAYNAMGASISIPLRIFDRNQGEKARTLIEIGRTERLRDASEAQVFSDVDSAYYTLVQNLNLLRPYKAKYLPLALDVRNRMTVSYQNGGASFLDFLDAEKSYRDTRLAYLNLIGSYLSAAAQMNMAVGREVIQ